MSYYRLLGFDREPFSTSPDPAFFYMSRIHAGALFRLRSSVELKRGLSLVVGDIGTGKTTLARRLSQIFYEDPRLDFHVILNPLHNNDQEFLKNLLSAFHIDCEKTAGTVDCLQMIERYLYRKGVEEKKTVVLLIDEAQQLSHSSLEVLRLLLNYETNEHKLLQLILVGQMELVPKLREAANLWDRISLKTIIPPLDQTGMQEMIRFRLKQANYSRNAPLFSDRALKLIFKKTKGFPRKINLLCHDALEYLIMGGKYQVDEEIVRVASQSEALLTAGART
jgi:general secretion pathway protein A